MSTIKHSAALEPSRPQAPLRMDGRIGVSGNLTAIEIDQDEPSERATNEKAKIEPNVAEPSRRNARTQPDREYVDLARTFAIVPIPPTDDDPAHAVWLVNLDEKGEIDLGPGEFVFARTTTREAALNYAMKLSDMLKLRVLEIAKA